MPGAFASALEPRVGPLRAPANQEATALIIRVLARRHREVNRPALLLEGGRQDCKLHDTILGPEESSCCMKPFVFLLLKKIQNIVKRQAPQSLDGPLVFTMMREKRLMDVTF